MTLCVLSQSEGYQKTLALSDAQRLANVQTIKCLWRNSPAVKLPDPAVWIRELPASIGIIQQKYPSMWRTVFTDARLEPMTSPMTPMAFHILKASTRCRGKAGQMQASQMLCSQPTGATMGTIMGRTGLELAQQPQDAMQMAMNSFATTIATTIAQALRPQTMGSNGREPEKGEPFISILGDSANDGAMAPKGIPAIHDAPVEDKTALEKKAKAIEKEPSESVGVVTERLLGHMARKPAAKSGKKKGMAKKPAASMKRVKKAGMAKKPAASGPSGPSSSDGRVKVDCEFKGWTCWKAPCGDKHYVSKDGSTQCRSKNEVRAAMGI